jgi:lysyl-tRNA synthetase class I
MTRTRAHSGYYAVVVVNVAATKPMNDLFRRLGRHPTQSTSDKGRNNYKPHLTIAYIRKDKAEALLHSLRASNNKKSSDKKKTSMALMTERAKMNKETEEEEEEKEGWGDEVGWKREGGGGGGIEFMLNETCVVDSFEFGWRDGTTTLIPRIP